MAGTKATQGNFGARKSSLNLKYEEFVPSSAWTEDSKCHYLLVDLPDFKKEDVKLQVDGSGNIIVSGERQVSENKYSYFEQVIKVPENSDIQKISGKFEGEILHVIVPKHIVLLEEKEEPGKNMNETTKANGTEEGIHEHEEVPNTGKNVNETTKANGTEEGIHEHEEVPNTGLGCCHCEKKEKTFEALSAQRETIEKWSKEASGMIEKLIKHKGIITIAILSFSLGVFVTRKFE